MCKAAAPRFGELFACIHFPMYRSFAASIPIQNIKSRVNVFTARLVTQTRCLPQAGIDAWNVNPIISMAIHFAPNIFCNENNSSSVMFAGTHNCTAP